MTVAGARRGGDPAAAAAALAGAVDGPFVLYERDGRWTVASGARAELRCDRERIRLRTPSGTREVAVTDRPLRQVADLLADLEIPRWTAYGWAAFELAHLLHGDPGRAGSGPLLHLLVPEREVTLGADAVGPAASRWPAPGAELDVTRTGGPRYRAAVAAAVRDIRADRLQKVILSRIVPVAGEIDLLATYVAGRRGNTPARSFALDLGGVAAAGFSPETVVEVSADGRVSTQPLAGTRALHGDPVADLARRVELLGDPKEVFEHAISVRLAQDELAGVCRPGSVRVEEFMAVRERGSVQHLASRVTGRLAGGLDAWDAFAALFPSITASGIPKAAAYDLIARYEEGPRGLYSGAVLALDAAGALDAALVLRTVFVQDGRTWLRAGAGIVAPSTPEREWDETCEKLRSLSRFLVPARRAATEEERNAVNTTPDTTPDLTVEGLRHTAADLTEEDAATIGPDTNLFELGLDSIALMRLVGTWRRAGIAVDFAELSENPTLDGWSKLLRERSPAGPGPEPAPAAVEPAGDPGPDDSFPLAVLQHAYWIGRGAGQELGGVAAHLYTEFDGSDVDPDVLRGALDRLVARHDMLRAVVTDNGRQVVAAESGWRGLTVHDLRALPPAERADRLAAVRDANSHRMLDIEAGEMFATALSLLPDGRTRLHVDVDMVAVDAVSYRIMLADLARAYADPGERRPAPGYGYRRYREAKPRARAEAAGRAAAWWRDRLPGLPGAPELAMAPTPPVGPPRVTRRAITLPPAHRAAIGAAARARGLTVAMAVATVFAEVVGAWSAQPRFLLNVPLFDREPLHPDVGEILGDFTGSVLLEIDLTERLTFAERVRRVQARMHADAAHADHTGVEVLRDLSRLRREPVRAPVVFTSALGLGELFDERVRRHFGEPVWIVSQGPQVLLDAQVTELSGGLLVNWDSREGELADGVVDAMFGAFAALVERLATDEGAWDAPVGPLLPRAQRERRALAADTAAPRSHRRLHDGFFAHAAADPAAPAVVAGRVLGYGELAERALRVAAALAGWGVAPGDPVGITLPPGPDQVVAVLGVLAAGGVYVPVGVEQPPARAARIAAVAGYDIVLTAQTLAAAGAAPPLAAPVPGGEEDLAYVLFTSGSTGEPKGVEVPHRAAMTTIDDLVGRFGIAASDRTLALSALDFDLSVFDLFAPLSVGGAVVTVPEGARRDAAAWGELIAAHGVTVLNCVPALLDMVLAARCDLDGLRLVLLGGDRIGVDLPARLAAVAPGCRFVGLGGTTETAIHSTVCEVEGPVPADWHCVPYGTPLANVVCRVVDGSGADAPDWVPGELWIGGDGVARGYRGDPDRTADRFVEHAGTRWYRTGDLARYRGDATIEFLGRRDDQVKIRGFRIELGEVEAALLADPDVTGAVAVVVGGSLAAGAVTGAEPDALRERLRAVVPGHMVPEWIVVLDALPLTANGKIDRRAVGAAVERRGPATGPAAQPPGTALERVVERVWCDVLGVPAVGAHADFFAAGGDSVLATSVVAGLRAALDTRAVSVRSLFAAPTVAGLAAELVRTQPRPGRLEAVAEVFWEVEALTDDEVRALSGEER